MALEDYGQMMMAAPSRLDSIEDLLMELRLNVTAELYKNEADEIDSTFARAINDLHNLQGKLKGLEDYLHAKYRALRDDD